MPKPNLQGMVTGTIGTLVGIIISMAAFWMVNASNYVTRDELQEYMDRQLHVMRDSISSEVRILNQSITSMADQNTTSNITVQNNTKAIQELNIQIAVLAKELEAGRK